MKRPVLRVLKVRVGFGRWSEVWAARCPACSHRMRLLKNWRGGGRPFGAVRCDCGGLLEFERFHPLMVGRGEEGGR
jgi:hypothetical protein